MAELVAPDRYKGFDPVYRFVLIPSAPAPGGSPQFLYAVPNNVAAIVRFVNCIIVGGGSVGTFSATLNGLYTFGEDQTLGFGGELVSASPATFNAVNSARITWSTDVDTAYDNTDPNWDHVSVVPLPITYLPPGARLTVEFKKSGGGDAAPYVDLGQVVVELVAEPAAAIGSDSGDQRVYLLQAAKPGDAGAFA